MELNREQIVKVLENAIRLGKFYSYMTPKLSYEELRDALSLIRELTEENEGLHAQVEQSEITIKDLRSRNSEFTRANMSLSRYADELQLELAECTQVKADTVRKMQERLMDTKTKICGEYYIYAENVNVIAKELLEEGSGDA